MSAPTLDSSAMQQFVQGFGGTVRLPGDAEYDAERAVWNGMIDRRPAIIARCTSTDDVVRAVRFAREQGLVLAVRGGGHNAAGLAVCDDGLVIDLRGMRGVEVDTSAGTARVQGGALWGDMDQATTAQGLAATGGAISTTGVAGLTLGGGIGWLMRKHGLACDNVIEVEVVTADGQVINANEHEHSDLFWAVRGGGGNFGVVTHFTFRVHPIGEAILGGMLAFPHARAAEILKFYREFVTTAPDELTVFAAQLTTPEGIPVIALVMGYFGPIEQGEALIAPLRALGPVMDAVQPMPYTALQTMLDEGFPSGMQVYWRSHFVGDLTDDFIDAVVSRVAAVTSPLSAVLIEQMGGAVARVPVDATAFPHREAKFNVAIVARWTDPAELDLHRQWARDIWSAMTPYATGGVYVNYLGVDDAPDRARDAYGQQTYARLAAVKATYDPDNIFKVNQNIVPAAASV